MYKLDLEKAEGQEIKLPTSVESQKKQGSFRKNVYFCVTDYANALNCVDHKKTVENFLRDEYQTTLPAS